MKQLFLTSDNGILTVQPQGEPTVAAQIWHIGKLFIYLQQLFFHTTLSHLNAIFGGYFEL